MNITKKLTTWRALAWDLPAWLMYPLLAFLVSRALVFGAGLVSDIMLPTDPGHWVADADSRFVSMWAKWDSQYYVDIADEGYWFTPKAQSNVAFFPLYPLLMRLIAPLSGDSVVQAGLLISNLSFLLALILLYALTEIELDAGAARRAVFYVSLFPTALFFSAVYTESLFMLLGVASMFFARKRWWLVAALLGMLASATRNVGALLWALVMWEWLRAQGWRLSQARKKETWRNLGQGLIRNWAEVFIIAIIPLGLFGYMYFLKENFESPLAFVETQAAWGRQMLGPIQSVANSVNQILAGDVNKGWITGLWNVAALVSFAAAVPFVWRKLGGGYAAYVLVQLIIASSAGTGSMIRYVLPLFPVFMLLGDWGRREWLDRSIVPTSAVMLGVFTAVFVNWIFVA